MDAPAIARNLLTAAGATVRGSYWCDHKGRAAVDPARRSYLRLQLNVGRGIRTLRIDAGDVDAIADLLPEGACA